MGNMHLIFNSRCETSLKRDFSTGIFLWILHNFSKNLITEHLLTIAPANFSIPTEVMSIDHTFLVFLIFFLLLLIIAIKEYFSLFTITYQKINMNVVQTICLINNLPTHIRENIDFPQQKPCQLQSGKANFEGWLS